MSRNTTTAAWMRGVADFLGDQGINLQALCDETGLQPQRLEGPDARVPSEMVSRVWESAVHLSGDDTIALASPGMARPANFEVVGYAMMSCPHLLAGLERLVRYTRIVSEAATTTLSESGEGWLLTFELYGGERPVPRQRFEFDMLALLNFCRWVCGREFSPLAVEFVHPAPGNVQPYREAFGCPVRFGAPRHGMLFARADLLRPLRTSNPLLAELHDRFAGERLDRLDTTRISLRAREVIIRKLPEGEPRREDVAGVLCMSERTLQRRLQDEGTSFHQLLDKTRMALAQQYLAQPQLSLAQAAYLLGFADQSNFHRACKRWFNLSPGQYRARSEALRNGGHAAH